MYASAYDSIPVVSPNANQPESFTIEELNIVPDYTILEGQTQQMKVEEYDEHVLFNSVVWSSSDPDVISCTKDGKITGIKEGKATIKVKAVFGNASDSITVYCSRKLSKTYYSKIRTPIAYTCYIPEFLKIQSFHLLFLQILRGEVLQVKGIYDPYFYVEYQRNGKSYEGFIYQYWMPEYIASDEIFRQLSTYDLNVFVNYENDSYKVTTNYKGNVVWKVSDTSIISFDSKTGKVVGKKPGIATISATVGNETLTCTVHSIYRWPLDWTGAAKNNTFVYIAKGDTYKKTSTELSIGDTFTVKGDMGDKSGWAYGVSGNGTWGYIPISDISTKNTISYYNNLEWTWPMYDSSIKYISSPYAPRNITASGSIHHRGIDITTGNPGEISGEYVVATCSGTVTKIHNNTSDCGYCISISTNCIDSVTNKNISIIYMHLQEKPKYKNGIAISSGDYISIGTIIGKVGNTNGNTDPNMGYHLHFETNNQNAAVGDSGRSDFKYTINPMFFFVYKDVSFSQTNSFSKYGGYWYNY